MPALSQQHQDPTPWPLSQDFLASALPSFPPPTKSHPHFICPQPAFYPTSSTSRRHCTVTLLSVPWKENRQAELSSRTTQSTATWTPTQKPALWIGHLFLLGIKQVKLTHKTKTDVRMTEELAQTTSQKLSCLLSASSPAKPRGLGNHQRPASITEDVQALIKSIWLLLTFLSGVKNCC